MGVKSNNHVMSTDIKLTSNTRLIYDIYFGYNYDYSSIKPGTKLSYKLNISVQDLKDATCLYI